MTTGRELVVPCSTILARLSASGILTPERQADLSRGFSHIKLSGLLGYQDVPIHVIAAMLTSATCVSDSEEIPKRLIERYAEACASHVLPIYEALHPEATSLPRYLLRLLWSNIPLNEGELMYVEKLKDSLQKEACSSVDWAAPHAITAVFNALCTQRSPHQVEFVCTQAQIARVCLGRALRDERYTSDSEATWQRQMLCDLVAEIEGTGRINSTAPI